MDAVEDGLLADVVAIGGDAGLEGSTRKCTGMIFVEEAAGGCDVIEGLTEVVIS